MSADAKRAFLMMLGAAFNAAVAGYAISWLIVR